MGACGGVRGVEVGGQVLRGSLLKMKLPLTPLKRQSPAAPRLTVECAPVPGGGPVVLSGGRGGVQIALAGCAVRR